MNLQSVFVAIITMSLVACGSLPPTAEQGLASVHEGAPRIVDGDTGVRPVVTESIASNGSGRSQDSKSMIHKLKRSVFFDYDQYMIKDEFKPLIDAHGKILVKNPSMKMLIQGNADERGSREYNLALGQKRAEAVRKALNLIGAREDQLESVSMGEERPRCHEQTESCMSQNRRSDMIYSGE